MSDMQEMRIVFPSPEKLLTPGVVTVLVLAIAGYVGWVLAPEAVVGALALNPRAVVHGRIWQLVTYPFVNGSYSLICNGLILLFIGSAIERQWRTASFLWLWLTVSVCCGIVWVLIGLLVGGSVAMVGFGANACGYGLIGTMGLLFRRRRYFVFFATLEAQHIALGLIVIGVLVSLRFPMNLIWVAGALVAYVYVKLRWSLEARGPLSAAPRRSGGRGKFVDID
jgi:membrane associated rhomboid family serine protease